MSALPNLNKRLFILLLRTADVKQLDVCQIAQCGNQTVVSVEKWFRELSVEKASRFCTNEAIEVVRKLELKRFKSEKDLWAKVRRITADIILRYYKGDDYLRPEESPSRQPDSADKSTGDVKRLLEAMRVTKESRDKGLGETNLILVYFDHAKGQYIGEVPDLGLYTSGETEEEAENKIYKLAEERNILVLPPDYDSSSDD